MNRPALSMNIGRSMILVVALLFGSPAMSIEEPEYTVRHTAGKVEFREYAPYLTAETLIEDAADF